MAYQNGPEYTLDRQMLVASVHFYQRLRFHIIGIDFFVRKRKKSLDIQSERSILETFSLILSF